MSKRDRFAANLDPYTGMEIRKIAEESGYSINDLFQNMAYFLINNLENLKELDRSLREEGELSEDQHGEHLMEFLFKNQGFNNLADWLYMSQHYPKVLQRKGFPVYPKFKRYGGEKTKHESYIDG